MKFAQLTVHATPLPPAGALQAGVGLQVIMGFFRHGIELPADKARELAAELLQAANQAEGKA